ERRGRMRALLSIETGQGAPLLCELQPDRPATLGRNRNNTIVLLDEHASRWHAEVFAEAGRWFIRDCDTMNGTRLNGERIQQPRPLEHGHIIAIGTPRLRFALADDDSNGRTPHQAEQARGLQPADLSHAALCADELTALCHFMAVCVEENHPPHLSLLPLR